MPPHDPSDVSVQPTRSTDYHIVAPFRSVINVAAMELVVVFKYCYKTSETVFWCFVPRQSLRAKIIDETYCKVDIFSQVPFIGTRII